MTVVSPAEADRARIQQHLQRVEADLRARDTHHLPPHLQAERRRNLDRLHTYRVAGVFPRNPEFMGARVPFFIDDDGIACAVGHLVLESGFAAVAAEIQDRENNALLLDIVHPALPGWIAQSGLTAEECAQIQPSYCGCDMTYEPVCGEDGKTYANACSAETCAGVTIAHEGVCKAQGTTTGWPEAGTSSGEASSTGDASTGDTGTGDTSTGDTTGEPEEDTERKGGCHMGQDLSAMFSLALPLLLLAPRRWRARA